MKKIIKYHLNIHKKYMLDQNLEGVPQKVRLPHPSEVQNWKGRGRRNFWARALKFCTDTYFLKIFKWYLHHFLISVTVCHLPKSWKAYYSRCCVFHGVGKVEKLSNMSLIKVVDFFKYTIKSVRKKSIFHGYDFFELRRYPAS